MFTGIITAIGRIAEAQPIGSGAQHGKRLAIDAPAGYLDDCGLGDSIALNGACMTVTTLDVPAGRFTIDVSAESLARTAGLDAAGGSVNLEKALRAGDRLGGHIVSGHVDGLGEVTAFAPVGESWRLAVRCGRELGRFIAVKGSITVQGVSLTVNEVADSGAGTEFAINLIPHTLQHTTLGELKPGARVNLEIDSLARYVARLIETAPQA